MKVLIPVFDSMISCRETAVMSFFYRSVTRVLAVLFLLPAWVVAPGRARCRACQWALGLRFPAEDLAGLAPGAREAFESARTLALWRDGVLIGLTSGYRDAGEQQRLFAADAGRRVLPPAESRHVTGTALDVRPEEGARWLEVHGAAHHLYRIYDNEWWHFEYRPGGRPQRVPHPGAREVVK